MGKIQFRYVKKHVAGIICSVGLTTDDVQNNLEKLLRSLLAPMVKDDLLADDLVKECD